MKAEWTNSDSLTTSQTTKAILVIDEMPSSCDKCEVRCDGYTAKEYAEKGIKKPSWCSLKPMPKKMEESWMETPNDCDYRMGWNDCLEEIENESKGNV